MDRLDRFDRFDRSMVAKPLSIFNERMGDLRRELNTLNEYGQRGVSGLWSLVSGLWSEFHHS